MPYELNADNVGNIYTHLTNFSLNKKNPTFRDNKEDFEGEVKNVLKNFTPGWLYEMEVY